MRRRYPTKLSKLPGDGLILFAEEGHQWIDNALT